MIVVVFILVEKGLLTVSQTVDQIGLIAFAGHDGTDLNTPAASIRAFVDGTSRAPTIARSPFVLHDCQWCEHSDGTDED